VATGNNDNDAEQPTALIEREALLGLIDRSAEPDRPRPHTVPRTRLRSRPARPSEVDIVDVSPLHPRARGSGMNLRDYDPRPRVLFAIVVVLLFTFVVAIQLR
jgi:hypothetical protein